MWHEYDRQYKGSCEIPWYWNVRACARVCVCVCVCVQLSRFEEGQQHELTSASENVPEGYAVGGFTFLTRIT